jgi:hypothetical protein
MLDATNRRLHDAFSLPACADRVAKQAIADLQTGTEPQVYDQPQADRVDM